MSSLYQILNIARQSMMARMQDLDNTSNNLANVNTTGYKSSRANFQELLSNANQMSGVELRSTQLMQGAGAVQTTLNNLDLSITGEGFFQVKLANGTLAYTRSGQFGLDAQSRIVTPDGNQLVWSGTVPAGAQNVLVSNNGEVSAEVNGVRTTLGTLQLARFSNPGALLVKGNSLYAPSDASGTATTGAPGTGNFGSLRANSLEQSNVNVALEMTHLITVQRSFQVSSKAFQQADTMMQEAIQMRKA